MDWISFKEFLLCSKTVVWMYNRFFKRPIDWKYRTLTNSDVKEFLTWINRIRPDCHIRFLDVGARGGLKQSIIYSGLSFLQNKLMHGIECDPIESERLQREEGYSKVYAEAVAGYTGDAILYVSKNAAGTSIRELVDGIGDLALDLRHESVIERRPIKVKKLNDIIGETMRYDFIKMNVEGIEYDILSSLNGDSLKETVCVCTEAQTVECHKGQHTSDEIQSLMRDKGFVLLDRIQNSQWEIQIEHWLIFVRNPTQIHTLDEWLKLIMIGFLMQKSGFVANCLMVGREKMGPHVLWHSIGKRIGIPDFEMYYEANMRAWGRSLP